VDLLAESPDADLASELDRDAAALEADVRRERTALLFAGEYDDRNALLSISAGAGGTEATDWAEMLLRMYLRWAERHRFATEIIDHLELFKRIEASPEDRPDVQALLRARLLDIFMHSELQGRRAYPECYGLHSWRRN
jgi:hypothetical protein